MQTDYVGPDGFILDLKTVACALPVAAAGERTRKAGRCAMSGIVKALLQGARCCCPTAAF